MMGTAAHPFESTFDGNGHKLTFNLQTSDADYCAPFSYTRGAEIENLIVDGTIQSSGHYAGGIIGHAEGTFTVLNCVVKTNIVSTGSGQAVYDSAALSEKPRVPPVLPLLPSPSPTACSTHAQSA